MSVNQYQTVQENLSSMQQASQQSFLMTILRPFMKMLGYPMGSLVHSGSNGQAIKKTKKTFLQSFASLFMFRLRLMPMVIFFAVMVLGVRFSTFVTHLGEGDFMKKAYAGQAKEEKKQIPLSHLDNLPEAQGHDLKALSDFDPFNMTADQYRVLKGIVAKSDHLSDRERSLSEKEQILQALLKKMDEKVGELKKAKVELEAVMNKIGEEENANTKRLVKMTEGMKPQKAAEVLQGVEFNILLEIMERLKEKKASAILANMDPKKASYLMTALSKRRKIFDKNNPSKSVMKG